MDAVYGAIMDMYGEFMEICKICWQDVGRDSLGRGLVNSMPSRIALTIFYMETLMCLSILVSMIMNIYRKLPVDRFIKFYAHDYQYVSEFCLYKYWYTCHDLHAQILIIHNLFLREWLKDLWNGFKYAVGFKYQHGHIEGLVQKRRNSSAFALELHLFCGNKSGFCCNIEYPSKTLLKLKFCETSFIQNSRFSCQIVLNICTEHGSDTAMLHAKF